MKLAIVLSLCTVAPVPAQAQVISTQPIFEPPLSFARDVFFGVNQATFDARSKAVLDALIAMLQERDLRAIRVAGHADGTGSAAYNERLALRRGVAVKAYLAAHGVPAERIQVEGRGLRQPVADNRIAQGRAKNRRVEMEIVAPLK